VVLYKMLGRSELPYLTFFRGFSYATALVTGVCFSVSCVYFLRRARPPASELSMPAAPAPAPAELG